MPYININLDDLTDEMLAKELVKRGYYVAVNRIDNNYNRFNNPELYMVIDILIHNNCPDNIIEMLEKHYQLQTISEELFNLLLETKRNDETAITTTEH